MGNEETKLAFVDGRDALAYLIIRPSDGGVELEASANGIGKPDAARILRHVADQWDPAAAGEVAKLRDQAARSDADHRTMDARATELEATLAATRKATQRLSSVLVASAHLLDKPFTNAPELSPWTRGVSPALNGLRSALGMSHAPAVEDDADHLARRDELAEIWTNHVGADLPPTPRIAAAINAVFAAGHECQAHHEHETQDRIEGES